MYRCTRQYRNASLICSCRQPLRHGAATCGAHSIHHQALRALS
jgi:hypothetical protein